MKTAVVTGSRKGIGLGCAERLCKEGYFVVVTGRQKTADLNHPRMRYMQCDIQNMDHITGFTKEVFKEYGRVDLLVNNAGVAPKERTDILSVPAESYDFVMNTNLKGTFFMCQAMAGAMIASLETEDFYQPRIINISSVSAYTSSVNRGEYCISKAGISMVTKLFAHRLAEYGIPVFEIRPGIIESDMTKLAGEQYREKIEQGLTPVKRMGSPEDIGSCVAALASGNLDFATGQVIDADGGFHIRRL